MSHHSIAWLVVLSVCLLSCSSEPVEAPVEANQDLREATEQKPNLEPITNPTADARNRLLAAETLVGGYEVPVGLKLLQARSDHLLFELYASVEQVKEFYTGIDRRNGLRFTERAYVLDPGANGFDVHHSTTTVERLRLPDQPDRGHIFVQTMNRKTHLLRVHPPVDKRRQAVATSEAFRSLPTTREKALSPSSESTTERSVKGDDKNTKRPTPFQLTSSGQPFRRDSTKKKKARAHPRQYAPYGNGRVQDLRNHVRQWQLDNPGETFYD